MKINKNISDSFIRLEEYIEQTGFLGWDPFDGLNSKFFQKNSFLRQNEPARLVWIQLFKRSPINLRNLLGVEKGYNAKGLGLLLTGYCNLWKINGDDSYLESINFLANKLISLRSEGYSGNCWGYNFDWQAKAFYQPKGTPSVVVTTFVGNSLIDAYECTGNKLYLETAIGIKDFILRDLNRTYDDNGDFSFSYSTVDSTQVFNASLLGAQMLSRIYGYNNEPELITEARRAVNYAVKRQNTDGSWPYGTLPHHKWIDNFHTGYNLESIALYSKYSGDDSFTDNLNKGFEYYINTFFEPNGIAKYYSDKVYPVDVHNPAQLIITLYKLDMLEQYFPLTEKVLEWTIRNMQSRKGFFYYKKYALFTNKNNYLRWTQAWMFCGMSYLFLRFKHQPAIGERSKNAMDVKTFK